MDIIENSYGIRRRLQFIEEIIRRYNPSTILDMGCGSGQLITMPISSKFVNIKVIGVDNDKESIENARTNNKYPNLSFEYPEKLTDADKFDLIIASEVIEHVECPVIFIASLHKHLTTSGKLIVTLPNGYGPFELMKFIESLLVLIGLRKLKRFLFGRCNIVISNRDTMADSPHINFFSYKQIQQLFIDTGFSIIQYEPRTFLCGLIFDQVVEKYHLVDWNQKVTDTLRPHNVSGWMFFLDKKSHSVLPIYKRNNFARLRKYINQNVMGSRR